MGAVLVPVLLLIVVIVAVAIALKQFGRRETQHSDTLQNADRPTLRYEVPEGQDPAVVLHELRKAGYDASADSEPGPSSAVLIIGSASGNPPDRERLRATLDRLDHANIDPSVNTALDRPPVRFLDER